MSINFFDLPVQGKSDLLRKASEQLSISEIIIEKDIWVCWILEKIFALPVKMAFKGGTSLSKVFNLIKRFSEDCDITIDYRNFSEELDLKNLSNTKLKKISEQLKSKLQVYISETVLPYLQEQVKKEFPSNSFQITLSDDGEQLRFYYHSFISDKSNEYLLDHVFVEFGVRNSTEPCEKHLVTSYLDQVLKKDWELPNPLVDTLSPIRTFWEKATLMHVECHRERLHNTPERLSRHWYDLCMLNNSWVGEKALASIDVLKDVIEHKKAFFNASYANYDDCLLGKFFLIPNEKGLKNLENDFKSMIEANMFYESPPKFNKIIEELKILEATINKTVLKHEQVNKNALKNEQNKPKRKQSL
jgi:hypothetical protein